MSHSPLLLDIASYFHYIYPLLFLKKKKKDTRKILEISKYRLEKF